jgi:hypothetical protein
MENELTLEQYRHNYTMITDATFVEVCNFYISSINGELTLSAVARRRYYSQFERVKLYFDYPVKSISLIYFYNIVSDLDVSEAEKIRFVNFCKKSLDFSSLSYRVSLPDFTVLAKANLKNG